MSCVTSVKKLIQASAERNLGENLWNVSSLPVDSVATGAYRSYLLREPLDISLSNFHCNCF